MTIQHPGRHRDVALLPSMRRLLLLAAVLVFLAGLPLLVFPSRTADWFAWTIDVGATAGFLGAAYWSSAVLEVAGARARSWGGARLSVWAVLVFTTLTLVVTLVHLDRLHLVAADSTSARVVAWGWLAVYAAVPVAMVVIVGLQGRHEPSSDEPPLPGRARLPQGLRGLLACLAIVLVGMGLGLLLAPVTFAQGWPWPHTPLTARAVGAWLVGLGWAAGHAWLIDEPARVWSLGATGVVFSVLQLYVLVRYADALSMSDPAAVAYVVVLAGIGIASGWILALRASPGSRSP